MSTPSDKHLEVSRPDRFDGPARALDAIRPVTPIWRRLVGFVLLMFCVAILVASYRETKIDPSQLWSNRGRAAEFLFGRSISSQERESARAQAERFPALLATERARDAIRDEKRTAGEPMPSEPALGREVRARAERMLASQDAAEKEAIIEREYASQIGKLRGGFFPPETDRAKLALYTSALVETLAIALWGTLLAVVAAVPLSLLAARTTLGILAPGESSSHRAMRWFSRFAVRRFLDGCRGFNEFVLALIIVAVIGLGPFTGVLALFVHSVGILGKVFSDAIDAMEQGPVEGVSSTGARPLQVISFAVLPQIMPHLVSNSLLRFETNVRSATILGVVGAGGIGFLMSDKINGYQYQEVCTMMLIVIIAVTLIDLACSRLMRAVV
ncbi:MAG: phosphonate ABC transporter, permease protein PhnE [Phycisphaerales bacterium]|nr:phosphonate ABC transporter, permease protein PhnE [Phycisphaerales bacterium]